MSSSNMKNIKIIGLIVLVAAIAGAYMYPKYAQNVTQVVAGAVGDTQQTPKMYQIVANGNGSYQSGAVNVGVYTLATMPNNDTNDRTITSIDAFYTGLGAVSTSSVANFAVSAATSTDTTTLNSNTNLIYGALVATSSPVAYEGSTTPGLSSVAGKAYIRIWKAGTNLNFVSTATTSATVIFKVNYIAQ